MGWRICRFEYDTDTVLLDEINHQERTAPSYLQTTGADEFPLEENVPLLMKTDEYYDDENVSINNFQTFYLILDENVETEDL